MKNAKEEAGQQVYRSDLGSKRPALRPSKIWRYKKLTSSLGQSVGRYESSWGCPVTDDVTPGILPWVIHKVCSGENVSRCWNPPVTPDNPRGSIKRLETLAFWMARLCFSLAVWLVVPSSLRLGLRWSKNSKSNKTSLILPWRPTYQIVVDLLDGRTHWPSDPLPHPLRWIPKARSLRLVSGSQEISDETLISPPPTTANSHPSAFPVGREGSALFFSAPPPRPARRRPKTSMPAELEEGTIVCFVIYYAAWVY